MFRKIVRWICNILTALLLVMAIFSMVTVISAKKDPNKIPSIFGLKPMSVLTGSMTPALKPGDMIFAKETAPEDIKVGDIITFKKGAILITHRVESIEENSGEIAFKTKGDANNVSDKDLVYEDMIIGTFAFKIPYGGYISNFAKSPIGFVLLIIIPASLLLYDEIIELFKTSESKDDIGDIKNTK